MTDIRSESDMEKLRAEMLEMLAGQPDGRVRVEMAMAHIAELKVLCDNATIQAQAGADQEKVIEKLKADFYGLAGKHEAVGWTTDMIEEAKKHQKQRKKGL